MSVSEKKTRALDSRENSFYGSSFCQIDGAVCELGWSIPTIVQFDELANGFIKGFWASNKR